MKINKLIIFVIFNLIISGCRVGPNYHRPCLDIPESYHFEEDNASGSLDISWWKQFDDQVLVDLIEEALANNKDIKIAAGNIIQAAGVLLQTRSQMFPQFGYSASAMVQRLSETTAFPVSPTTPNPQRTFQALATVSWEIDLWGRISRLSESAQDQFFSTIEARRGVILSLVASVANIYLQIRGLDEQLAIAIKTRDSYDEAVRYFELQFDHGQVSQMTVASAKTQYEIAAAQVPQIQLQIVELENSLSVVLGRNPGPIPRGKSIMDLTLPQVPAGIPSLILAQRPDIMQAEYNLMAANAQIGAAIALYFPSFSLTGAYGGTSQDLNKVFSKPSMTANYTGSMLGPIFTFGNIYGQVLQAEGATMSAYNAYLLAILNAFADVENSLAARVYLTEQLESQVKLIDAASDYVRLSKLQFHGGYSPYFVVIQAQQQLFPAELSWAQTKVLLFGSLVDIYRSLGGGWVYIAETMTTGKLCD